MQSREMTVSLKSTHLIMASTDIMENMGSTMSIMRNMDIKVIPSIMAYKGITGIMAYKGIMAIMGILKSKGKITKTDMKVKMNGMQR